MSVSSTFSRLPELPEKLRLALAEAALGEPYLEFQEAAFGALIEEQGINRPDKVILRYPDLLPEIRERIAGMRERFIGVAHEEIRRGPGGARRGAYQVLADIGDIDQAPLLSQGVRDESALVREHVVGALEKLALRYHSHQLNARSHQDANSRRFLREKREGMMAALRETLLSFPVHGKRVFLEVALEEGGDAYALITDILLSHRDGPLARALRTLLERSHREATVEFLFHLLAESDRSLRHLALGVMGERRDAAFAGAVADYLERLPETEREALIGRLEDIPWWGSIEASTDLRADACISTIEFLLIARIPRDRRGEMLVHFMGSPHAEVRRLAFETAIALDDPRALELAVRLLKDPAEEVALAAAQAIVRLNPPDKLHHLTPLLNAPSPRLRRLATREVASSSFARYMKSFDRLNARTRAMAARALAKIDSSMHDRLAEEVSSLDAERRLKALRIVEYVGAQKDLREPLKELLADPDRRVRATAIKIVQLSGDVAGMKQLISALSDPDRRVRANAVEAFEEIGDTRFIQLLVPFLKDRDNRVRANAAKALWNLGRLDVKEVVEEMLEDPDENMRLSAVWAIDEIGYDGAMGVLQEQLLIERSETVRARINEALGRETPAEGA